MVEPAKVARYLARAAKIDPERVAVHLDPTNRKMSVTVREVEGSPCSACRAVRYYAYHALRTWFDGSWDCEVWPSD